MAREGSRRCELCGAVARLRCQRCRLAFYCDVDHQEADRVGIHEQICQLLIPIRTPLPHGLSEEERKLGLAQLLERQEHVAAVALGAARRFVRDGEPRGAVPGALCALRFAAAAHGPDSVRLVPAYLALAEASAGAGDLSQASTYLSRAQWIVLSTPGCSVAVQAELQLSLGLFCVAEGNLEQALYHLATSIYLATSTFGLNSLETSGGYFHMANVFFRQNKVDIANSLYAEVTSIWRAFLLRSLQAQEQTQEARAEPAPLDREKEGDAQRLTEDQEAEGIRVLTKVLEVREQAPKQQPGETAKVLHALAMLWYLTGDLPKAREVGVKALDLVKQQPQQDSSEAIDHLLKLINSKLSKAK